MSTGYSGRTAQLAIALTTDATNSTTFGDIVSIGGPEISRDALDVSSMGTAANAEWRTFITGMIDPGEVTLELNMQETNAQKLQALLTNTATSQYMTITFPDASAATFSAYCYLSSLGYSIPFDDKISQSCTIKLTGKGTWTA